MGIAKDLKDAVRQQWKTPGFTMAVVLLLALAIGGNTAVFSVINAVLLRPLAYEDHERLVAISETLREQGAFPVSYPNYKDWRRQQDKFESMAAYAPLPTTLTGLSSAERITVSYVSCDFFATLRVKPLLGRDFTDQDDRPGSVRTALLAHDFWQSRFGADPEVLGRSLVLDGNIHTVIGVLPASFRLHRPGDVFTPIEPVATALNFENRKDHTVSVVGRLKPDSTLFEAAVQLDTIGARLAQEHPDANAGVGIRAIPLRQLLVGDNTRRLLILFSAVGLVLLITCMNVANLFLARSAERQREVGIRIALGASGRQIARLFLAESVVLSLLAATVGIVLASFFRDLLAVFLPWGFTAQDLRIDSSVLAFTVCIACLTGVLFGLTPAVHAFRISPVQAVKEDFRSSQGSHRSRLRSGLVMSQVALAMVLVTGAGLLFESLWRISNVHPGCRPENLITLHVGSSYGLESPSLYRKPQFYKQLIERVEALPGVVSAGGTAFLPLKDWGGIGAFSRVDRPPVRLDQCPEVYYNAASPDFFRTMGIPLKKGRLFTPRNDQMPHFGNLREAEAWFQKTVFEVVINETMARRFWQGEEAVGKRFRWMSEHGPGVEVVGIVGDVLHHGLDQEPRPAFFMSAYQSLWDLWLVVRSDRNPQALTASIRKVISEVDPDAPVSEVETFEGIVSSSFGSRRANAVMIGGFAAVALVLAAIGIYGVVSYSVTQRTRELGIRLALGATPRNLLGSALGPVILMVGIGVVIGTGMGLGLTRAIRSMLFGTSPADPVTFLAVAAILCGVGLLAGYLPARRVLRVDPVAVLKAD
jgi:putative ABC transport system permease protein